MLDEHNKTLELEEAWYYIGIPRDTKRIQVCVEIIKYSDDGDELINVVGNYENDEIREMIERGVTTIKYLRESSDTYDTDAHERLKYAAGRNLPGFLKVPANSVKIEFTFYTNDGHTVLLQLLDRIMHGFRNGMEYDDPDAIFQLSDEFQDIEDLLNGEKIWL